jgi:cellulose synthase/poly-beta-1,6-N-acetylglucosamine synthase-like glycosyltransferase
MTTATATRTPPLLVAPAAAKVDVSVLIPVLDEALHLRRTAALMREQDLDGTIELLFIDGGSSDDSLEILRDLQRQDPRIRVLHNPGRTVPRALNIGLRAARGRYVARMDAHTAYEPDYLRRGIERLDRGDVAWVSGPQIPLGDDRWSRRVALVLSTGAGRGASDKWRADAAADDERDEEWPLTTSVFTGVWTRRTLDELGGWDDAQVVNEDSEMAARMLARGQQIVCLASMGSRYRPRGSLRALWQQYRRYGRYRARTFVLHPQSAGPLRVATVGLPPLLALAAAPGPVGRLARVGSVAYLGVVGASVARLRAPSADRLPLGAALVTMHLSWSLGFSEGLVRYLPRRHAIRRSAPTAIRRG